MNKELVSIIIPTFKRTNTLKRAIYSAINQSYNNIEVIVVDDNANYPDIRSENKKLIKEINFSNLIFIENKENLGGGLARNEGIKKANGKYVAFLDDDDEYLPNKIERQIELYKKLNNENIAMIYCYAEMINTDGTSYISRREINGNNILEHVKCCVAATSWWFCPKDKLLSVGGFEDISSRQDATLLLKLLLKGYEFYCEPTILLKYYWHDSKSGISKTNIKSIKAEEQYREIFKNNCSNMKRKEINKVLYVFSFRLAHLYILLKDRKKALIELHTMIKLKFFSINNLRIFLGILFNNTYCLISKKRNNKRT